MKIYINNAEQVCQKGKTLFNLLLEMNMNEAKGIAIAVNDIVVSKSEWQKFLLNDNDKIIIIRATQGG